MMIDSAARQLADLATAKPIEEHHIGLSTPLPRYSGFPWWYALLVSPGRERKTAERLQRQDVFVYLPAYTKRVAMRCRKKQLRLFPIISGMLFVPCEMMAIDRRDELFDLCGVTDYLHQATGTPTLLSKAVIEQIRELEARENMQRKRPLHAFQMDQQVRFKDRMLDDSWGPGTITALALDGRIRVEVKKLFGRATPIWVSASEIVAM